MKITEAVTELIMANQPVETEETSYDEARSGGAMAIFEENYGDRVRVVSAGNESVELEVGAPNIRLQYDVYHMQKMEGNLVGTMGRIIHRIGHVQIADNPGRHEPGTGEINFGTVLRALDEMGYNGFVGLEYTPTAHTLASLGWIKGMVTTGSIS